MKRKSQPLLSIAPYIALLGIVAGLTGCGGGSSSVSTFTIGGNLSGLASGKSVVLLNNGGDALTASSDGTFTFATVLLSGQTYEIKVDTQPAGQTCTVSNGAGAVLDRNITNVAVTCVTDAYTVGGSVTGLGSGKSLVLQNNGADDLTVNADGTFTFATSVESGSSYAITVLTQPTNQSCSIDNPSGAITNANVSNVSVACRGWGTAALIESDDAGDANNPQVAVDDGGNAVAVWPQFDGSRTNILANRYVAGSGWIGAIPIESDSGAASAPHIAVDGTGNAVVVWSQADTTPRINIWANHFTLGVGWAAPSLIESDDTGDAQAPHIAINGNDDTEAMWAQSDGLRTNIWANHYTVGWGWSTAALIETDNAGDAVNPRIAIDASGNALAVWQQADGSARINIWANRYTAGGAWGTAALIESDDSGDAGNPQIAVDADGNALAVWQQTDGSARINIRANRYTAGSGWGTATLIETDDSGDATNPQIAVDGKGNALAVWQQADGSARINIWANAYSIDTGWEAAELIETDNAGNATNPRVAVDDNGNAVAVWEQIDGAARSNIWANTYR